MTWQNLSNIPFLLLCLFILRDDIRVAAYNRNVQAFQLYRSPVVSRIHRPCSYSLGSGETLPSTIPSPGPAETASVIESPIAAVTATDIDTTSATVAPAAAAVTIETVSEVTVARTRTDTPLPAVPTLPPVAEKEKEKEKKKKNLLSRDTTEIIRDSTIVISSVTNPLIEGNSGEEGEKVRLRRPNISYLLIRRTLLHYKMRYGDLLVPTIFTVPGESNSDDWPAEMWDIPLGKIVQSIRAGRRKDKKEDLLSIGFKYQVTEVKFDIIKLSLKTYKKIHRDYFVPRKFVVPESELWPRTCWGLRLGDTVSNIRSGISSYVDRKDELLAMGFIYDVTEKRNDNIKVALLHYKKLLDIEKEKAKEKAKEKENSISSNNANSENSESDTNSNTNNEDDAIMKSTKNSKNTKNTKNTKNKKINKIFDYKNLVVPKNSKWPRETWGIHLGNAIKNVKRGRCKSIRVEDIGLDFLIVKKRVKMEGGQENLIENS